MYNPPMVVYADMLFIENMIIGWVLLYLTGEICGRGSIRVQSDIQRMPSRYKWRLLAGSIMCGVFSLVIFIHIKAPLMLLMEAAFAFAACTVTFSYRRMKNVKFALHRSFTWIPWRHAVTFILVTYFMGGMTMGLLLLTRNNGIYTAVGIYTGDMKAALLALFIGMSTMTVKQVINAVRKKKLYKENTYDVVIHHGDKAIDTKAFLDTGNHLKEPITGKPVAVASEDLWNEMQRAGLHDPGLVVIPYETIGARGLLEGVRIDQIDIGEMRIKKCIIAKGNNKQFVRSGVDESGGRKYELLLSAEMKGEKGIW